MQCPSEDTSAGLILSQEMPTSAVNDAVVPSKEGVLSIAPSEFSRITQMALHCPCPEIIFDFSLNGL